MSGAYFLYCGEGNTNVVQLAGDVVGLGGYIEGDTVFCTKNGTWIGENLSLRSCASKCICSFVPNNQY